MKFNFDGVKVIVYRNENNARHFWKAIGKFSNLSKVERDGVWYECYIDFRTDGDKCFIILRDLMITDEGIIKYHERGVYKEFPITYKRKTLIEILLNRHSINHRVFKFRSTIYKRRNTIFVFSISILLALVYYFGNEHYNNQWAKFIADNTAIQALFILLNIFSIGSIFFPFTIQKQIEPDDIRKIFAEEVKNREQNEIARNLSHL